MIHGVSLGLRASLSPTLFSSLSGSTTHSMTFIHLSFFFFLIYVQSREVSGNGTEQEGFFKEINSIITPRQSKEVLF